MMMFPVFDRASKYYVRNVGWVCTDTTGVKFEKRIHIHTEILVNCTVNTRERQWQRKTMRNSVYYRKTNSLLLLRSTVLGDAVKDL
jgi:hypothetical protein